MTAMIERPAPAIATIPTHGDPACDLRRLRAGGAGFLCHHNPGPCRHLKTFLIMRA